MSAAVDPNGARELAIEELRLEHFRDLVGESFAWEAAGRSLSLELREAEARGAAFFEGGRPPFSLLFGSPSACGLPQGQYVIAHPSLGRVELFLVPIAPEGDTELYEAVFA